jgi:hypothetical protein
VSAQFLKTQLGKNTHESVIVEGINCWCSKYGFGHVPPYGGTHKRSQTISASENEKGRAPLAALFQQPAKRWRWNSLAIRSSKVRVTHLLLSTRRLFVTEKTPETLFACSPAMFLSIWLSTTPSSVTFPFLTMMWIGGTACNAYRFSAACP